MKIQPAPAASAVTARTAQAPPAALADFAGGTDLEEVAAVLVVLEDFLLHAGSRVACELAAYPLARPDDPHGWVRWVAGLLGEHAAILRALIPINSALPAHPPIGEPR